MFAMQGRQQTTAFSSYPQALGKPLTATSASVTSNRFLAPFLLKISLEASFHTPNSPEMFTVEGPSQRTSSYLIPTCSFTNIYFAATPRSFSGLGHRHFHMLTEPVAPAGTQPTLHKLDLSSHFLPLLLFALQHH